MNDTSGDINDLWDEVIYLFTNYTAIKNSNYLQGSAISGLETSAGEHTAQIEANTAAKIEIKGQTEANTAAKVDTISNIWV